jgi:hypothetical protein
VVENLERHGWGRVRRVRIMRLMETGVESRWVDILGRSVHEESERRGKGR